MIFRLHTFSADWGIWRYMCHYSLSQVGLSISPIAEIIFSESDNRVQPLRPTPLSIFTTLGDGREPSAEPPKSVPSVSGAGSILDPSPQLPQSVP